MIPKGNFLLLNRTAHSILDFTNDTYILEKTLEELALTQEQLYELWQSEDITLRRVALIGLGKYSLSEECIKAALQDNDATIRSIALNLSKETIYV